MQINDVQKQFFLWEFTVKKYLIIPVIFVLIAGLIAGIACSDDEDDNAEVPFMPGSGVLTVDLSLFTSPPTLRPAETCADFDTARVIVTVWSYLTTTFFAMPRIAFFLAIVQPAEYAGDLTWEWNFNFDGNTSIHMTAQAVSGDSVEWKMFVSDIEDGWDHFLWYSGKCDFEATGGWWEFHDPDLPADSNDVLWTGWEKNESDTTGKLTLINTNEFNDGYGDTLYYELDGTTAFAWIRDIDSSRFGRWEITWDIEDYYGMITYPEGHSRCWDTSLECTDCDSIPLK